MGFILKIALMISLFFNVALYYDLMDIDQYKNYVDKTISDVKDITDSEEFKNLQSLVKDKFTSVYQENVWDIGLDTITSWIQETVKKEWISAAAKTLSEQYPALSEEQINQLIEAASKVITKEETE